jgi:hypothetical protein
MKKAYMCVVVSSVFDLGLISLQQRLHAIGNGGAYT